MLYVQAARQGSARIHTLRSANQFPSARQFTSRAAAGGAPKCVTGVRYEKGAKDPVRKKG
jgi:hypothetical protein